MNKNYPALLNSFSKGTGFVQYQIDSFNDFINFRLQNVVDSIGTIKPEIPGLENFELRLGKIRVEKPSIKEADGAVRRTLPVEARLRGLTYMAPMFLEMTAVLNDVEQETEEINIGELPIMLKSNRCDLSNMSDEELTKAGEDPYDAGGYFIVNGTERVLILIEEIAPNRMILEKKAGDCTIRINSERDGFVQRHLLEKKADGTLVISFANVKKLPVIALFKALGIEKDKNIISIVSESPEILDELYPNMYELDLKTADDALDYIGKHIKVIQKEYRKTRAEQIIDKYLLPHLGNTPATKGEKAKYLGKAVHKIIKLGFDETLKDDIDHYANKRVRASGDLLEVLFRSIMLGRWGLIARIKYTYQKLAKRAKIAGIQSVVEANVVTNQFVSSMATGSWVGGRTGVSQRLERSNYVRSLSHLRNALSPLTTTQEHFEARELHPTHWGRFCPAETPEGPSIGLRKHLALMSSITKGLTLDEKDDVERFILKTING